MHHAEFFEFAGPCESWPNNIMDAFVSDVCSENVKTISKFAYEHGVPCRVLVDVLRDLPGGRAPDEYVLYAEGLYAMWDEEKAAQQQESAQQTSEPSASSLPSHPQRSQPAASAGLDWCLTLEKYGGPISGWPVEVLQALKSSESDNTSNTIAAWGYFHSIPLDELTDVLQGQLDCTGDPARIAIMVQVYEDLYRSDKALAMALSAAAVEEEDSLMQEEDVQEVEAGVQQVKDVRQEEKKIPLSSPSPPAFTVVDLTQEPELSTSSQSFVAGPDLSRAEVLGRLGGKYVYSLLNRKDTDPSLDSWKNLLRFLRPPKDWPLDIRHAFAGNNDETNVLFISTFAFINKVPSSILCDYLLSRPHGIESSAIKKIQQYYEM